MIETGQKNFSRFFSIVLLLIIAAFTIGYSSVNEVSASLLLSTVVGVFLCGIIFVTSKHVVNPFFFTGLVSVAAFYLRISILS